MKFRIIPILLLTLLVSECHSQTKTKSLRDRVKEGSTIPDYQVALNFINDYTKHCNTPESTIKDTTWIKINNLVTRRFKQTYIKLMDSASKADPELGLGFDPIFDAQDYPEKGFELVSYNPTDRLVTVRGKDWADFILVLRITNENNRWLVDGAGVVNIPADIRARR